MVVTAEKYALQRLEALAHSRDHSAKSVPAVLFLCVHNAGRSQMALGWFNHLAAGRAVAWSGGSEPGSELNPDVVKAMAEVGIESPSLGGGRRRRDHGLRCLVPPRVPGKRYEDWDLEDTTDKSLEEIRPIREAVKARVELLLAEIVPASRP